MNGELPFFERALRVTHAHVAHRAIPPTRFEPWTNRQPKSPAYRQHVGLAAIDQETGKTTYCYGAPDFTAETPHINIHLGPEGDPDVDPIVARVAITWDG